MSRKCKFPACPAGIIPFKNSSTPRLQTREGEVSVRLTPRDSFDSFCLALLPLAVASSSAVSSVSG